MDFPAGSKGLFSPRALVKGVSGALLPPHSYLHLSKDSIKWELIQLCQHVLPLTPSPLLPPTKVVEVKEAIRLQLRVTQESMAIQ